MMRAALGPLCGSRDGPLLPAAEVGADLLGAVIGSNSAKQKSRDEPSEWISVSACLVPSDGRERQLTSQKDGQ